MALGNQCSFHSGYLPKSSRLILILNYDYISNNNERTALANGILVTQGDTPYSTFTRNDSIHCLSALLSFAMKHWLLRNHHHCNVVIIILEYYIIIVCVCVQ